MPTSFKKALLQFLVVLQTIAPLVHAHPVVEGLTGGLHVPGLEQFNAEYGDDALALFDSVVIDLDQGIENERTVVPDFGQYIVSFIALELPKPAELLSFEVAFSPPPKLLAGRPASSPQAPRAPPVQL